MLAVATAVAGAEVVGAPVFENEIRLAGLQHIHAGSLFRRASQSQRAWASQTALPSKMVAPPLLISVFVPKGQSTAQQMPPTLDRASRVLGHHSNCCR
jgi:hypothetical protein